MQDSVPASIAPAIVFFNRLDSWPLNFLNTVKMAKPSMVAMINRVTQGLGFAKMKVSAYPVSTSWIDIRTEASRISRSRRIPRFLTIARTSRTNRYEKMTCQTDN